MKWEYGRIEEALRYLAGILEIEEAPRIGLVVCGGTALAAMKFVARATKDVDIVALMDKNERLFDPAPLPENLIKAAKETAQALTLPDNWLNNGPSSGDGGLFRLGLPDGFAKRLTKVSFGKSLDVYFIGRLDQIHFKLYASIDRSGYHADDLRRLEPSTEELRTAAAWSFTHDPSEGYKEMAKLFLRSFGYEKVAEEI
jgi:hypothetical protein